MIFHCFIGGSPTKKPRVQMDEAALQIPLDNGFRRTTTIHAIGKRGFIGEVLYYGPCGKKMKTIPDVMRVSYPFVTAQKISSEFISQCKFYIEVKTEKFQFFFSVP